MTSHTFVSESSETVSCLICGGVWDDDYEGRRSPCSGNTRAVHGDPWEQGHGLECDHYREQETCSHLEAPQGCNCNHCTY